MNTEAQKAVRTELWTRAFILFCAVMLTAALSTLVYLATQNRATLLRVNDCTTPGEPCFEDGQKRTASAVGDINQVSVLAAACAADLPGGLSPTERTARVIECVQDQLPR